LSEDTVKGEETWGVDLGVLPLGEYGFAVRATYASVAAYGDSNGSEDGVDAAKLGTISVTSGACRVEQQTGSAARQAPIARSPAHSSWPPPSARVG